MPRAKRVVESALQSKGFRLEHSHHRLFIYYTQQGEKTAVRTRTSQGGGELDEFLLGQMAKQCKLPKAAFLELVDCTLDQPGYEKRLADSDAL
jgi:hypothetical protein